MEKTTPKRLYRSETDRMVAGVAGGIAEYMAVDSTVIRLLFLVLAVAGGSGVLLYFLCWLFIPSASDIGSQNRQTVDGQVEQVADEVRALWAENQSQARLGTLLIVIGVVFLLSNLGLLAIRTVIKFWPLLLLYLGWQMLNRPRK